MTATTCDTGSGLLRAVLADPASDDSRLIYADYLDEQGEADRAEFIRVQVELAKKLAGIQTHHWYSLDMILDPQDADHQAWKQTIWRLQKREREMVKLFEWQGFRTAFGLPQHWPAWHLSAGPADWTAPPVPHWCGGVLRRGFVDEIRLPLAAYLEHARDLFNRHPVTAVVLTGLEPYWNGAGHCWFRADRGRQSNAVPTFAELPPELFNRLAGWHIDLTRGERWRPYRSQDAATAALSAACVAYGRHLADRLTRRPEPSPTRAGGDRGQRSAKSTPGGPGPPRP